MSKNTNLHQAKKAKNDEFYTRYEDIEKEVQYYDLKGMRVYCPCDDYHWSNFVKYFKDNYEKLGITGLVATNYDIGDGAWKYTYDGKTETVVKLEGDGDFRSEECTRIKDEECDIVVTNPPFSLFRKYVEQLMEYGKKFIIIGNGNAVTYKEIFPLIKENKMWLGASKGIGGKFTFIVPDTYDGKFVSVINGKRIGQINNACWFTNVEHAKRNTPLDLYKRYSFEDYPKYDNYDAIEVSKVELIPMDYDGVMGVPITFLDKYCREQFEIIGYDHNLDGKGTSISQFEVNGKGVYKRILIRKRTT